MKHVASHLLNILARFAFDWYHVVRIMVPKTIRLLVSVVLHEMVSSEEKELKWDQKRVASYLCDVLARFAFDWCHVRENLGRWLLLDFRDGACFIAVLHLESNFLFVFRHCSRMLVRKSRVVL
jgi:hypothetical protein